MEWSRRRRIRVMNEEYMEEVERNNLVIRVDNIHKTWLPFKLHIFLLILCINTHTHPPFPFPSLFCFKYFITFNIISICIFGSRILSYCNVISLFVIRFSLYEDELNIRPWAFFPSLYYIILVNSHRHTYRSERYLFLQCFWMLFNL